MSKIILPRDVVAQYLKRANLIFQVGVRLSTDASEWSRYVDPYGRDYEEVLSQLEDRVEGMLKKISRQSGSHGLTGMTIDVKAVRGGLEVTGKMSESSDVEYDVAMVDLDLAFERVLQVLAKEDRGLSLLITGVETRGKIPTITRG